MTHAGSSPPPTASPSAPEVEQRARTTLGSSAPAIYHLAARVIGRRHGGGGTLLDVGCGTGNLWDYTKTRFDAYLGVDVVRYEPFPEAGRFVQVDLDSGRVPLPDASAEVVASIETIEHVENPRAFMRELVRLTKPGGWVIVTTPNQLSLMSKLGLVLKNQFPAFQEAPGLYPSHLSALLEIDLIRIARECGLVDPAIHYTDRGRVPLTRWHWPRGFRGRWFSDHVLMEASRP